MVKVTKPPKKRRKAQKAPNKTTLIKNPSPAFEAALQAVATMKKDKKDK